MNILISLSKARQNLYHFTTVRGLLGIVQKGKIGHEPGWVSFTRNRRLNWNCGDAGRVCFVMDWDKMKYKYRGEPFSYEFDDYGKIDHSKIRAESEERFFGPISIKYAKQILVDAKASSTIIAQYKETKAQLHFLEKHNDIIANDDWNENTARLVMGKKWKNGLFQFWKKRFGPNYRPGEWRLLTEAELDDRIKAAHSLIEIYQKTLQLITEGL